MERQTTATLLEEQEEKLSDQNTATAATADKLFAKALTNLSFHDRTTIEDEIHGVSCIAVEETPDLLESSLIHFELELHRIDSKPAYDKAQELLLLSSNPFSICCYINDNNFRLRFLRCELFDVRKAAKRFIRYLDFVAEVYGEYALQRPICMSDFSREEMLFLREGGRQLLPYRDQSGRRIFSFFGYDKQKSLSNNSFLKVIFYILNTCIDSCDTTNNDFNNIESLQKGVILITYVPPNNFIASAQSNLEIHRVRLSSLARILQCVPIRIVSIHLCYPNTEAYKIKGKIFSMVSSVWNTRAKIHLGNPVEWRYALQGYGIPSKIIPLTNTGTIKLDNWKKWIKLKKYTEQQEMTVSMKTSIKTPMNSIVECPGSNDVVFRMGKSMNYHPGNIKFQNMIDSQFQHHSGPYTTRTQKEAIETEVIQNVKREGGRFLKWESDKGWWINMSVEMCVDLNSDIDMDVINISTMNSVPTGANIDTDSDRNTNENTNENVNVNVSLNSRTNSVEYFKAEKEIQSKVNFAFRHFKKRMIRAQQKQQQLQVSASSTYVFEQQDGQKRRRSNNSDSATTIMGSNTNSGNNSNICMPFLPDMNGNACGYFFSSANGSSYDYNSI
mmetsp:Transcript_39887/g.44550  ORF Transcript_39887/g.44550 Transcript_39887/m.44550 type:complete len:614 (-) Transcript_39887:459-2300(-)